MSLGHSICCCRHCWLMLPCTSTAKSVDKHQSQVVKQEERFPWLVNVNNVTLAGTTKAACSVLSDQCSSIRPAHELSGCPGHHECEFTAPMHSDDCAPHMTWWLPQARCNKATSWIKELSC